MKKELTKKIILGYLHEYRENHQIQAKDLVRALNIHKSTVTTYLQELETSGQVTRVKEGYKVYWAVKPFVITPALLLRRRWTAKIFTAPAAIKEKNCE